MVVDGWPPQAGWLLGGGLPAAGRDHIYIYIFTYIYIYIYIWLVVSTPLKNMSQLGWLFPIYGKIKNVPNHQPELIEVWRICTTGIQESLDVSNNLLGVLPSQALTLSSSDNEPQKVCCTDSHAACRLRILEVLTQVLRGTQWQSILNSTKNGWRKPWPNIPIIPI